MNDPKTNAEPSMEEILASIRQIINQGDEKPAAPAGQAADAPSPADPSPPLPPGTAASAPAPGAAQQAVVDDVLDLTEELATAPEPQEIDLVDSKDIKTVAPAVAPAAAPVMPQPPVPAARQGGGQMAPAHPVAEEEDGLLSERVEHVATETISRHLTNALHQREATLPRLTGLGNGEVTLESMVLEILRPMLKGWLDTHLPEIVEKIVRREVAKLVRRVQEDL